MGSLYSALSISVGALEAQQAGLETTTNNLANMNTPGYSRQRPVLQEADPIIQGRLAFGNGVSLTGIESLRDSLLNVQIADEMQQQSRSQAFVDTMNQLQPLFPSDTSGIGAAISGFFSSLNSLSSNPTDSSLRQNALSTANNLATSFNQTAGQLTSTRSNLDLNVQQDVEEVNQITSQIASINQTLATVSSTGSEYGSFLDQRDALVQQLSGLIDVSVLQQGSSLTLTTRQGTALVVDSQSFNLTTRLDPDDGTQHIYAEAGDITGSISGGKLGGALEARDQEIPSMLGQLDTLASALVTKLNAAHQMGFDLNGDPGGNLFNPLTGAGAAAGMSVAITDPNLLAASSDSNSPGSNGNIANLSAVANDAVYNGMTPIQTYGNLVFQVGSSISNANADLTASTNVLQQLQQQQSSVSGVSLDEEASNLMLYERAYQAAARAISTVDQMLQTAINMGA